MSLNDTTTSGDQLPPELAELAAVAAAADARNAAADPAAQAQAQAQAVQAQADAEQASRVASMADDLAVLLTPVMEGIRESAPWTARRLTDEWTGRHATLVAAVFVKRGWDIDRFLSPEVMLAGSLLVTGVQLSRDAKQYAAWQAAQQAKQQQPATDGG